VSLLAQKVGFTAFRPFAFDAKTRHH